MGEIHTGLLQNSVAVPTAQAVDLLTLSHDERVLTSARPMPVAVSPSALTSVDCSIATGSGAAVRGIGTIWSRTVLTGGHVLQGSAFSRLDRGESARRLPWSHYLARPGTVEYIGRDLRTDDLVDGLLVDRSAAGIDFASVSTRAMGRVASSPTLDRRPPFRMERIRLRWVVHEPPAGTPERVAFRVASETVRTIRIATKDGELAAAVQFCEELAFHDWLLTALLRLIERAHAADDEEGSRARMLRPAVEHLLHLWMPRQRVDSSWGLIWDGLEATAGFSRQWATSVNRVRDQIAVATLALLEKAAGP